MPALTRKFKKIFAANAINNGVFGSKAAGVPANSTNPETIESLNAFLNGWDDATQGGLKLPTLEDMQGLKYDTDYHLAYIYQTGMQVYNSQTTYYTNDLVRKDATTEIWKSLINNNTGNALVSGSNWSLVGNLANIPTSSIVDASTTAKGIGLLPSLITIANNATDANNDIDCSAGVFQFSDGSGQAVATAMTKRLDANWAAGTNQGGLDTGTKTNSIWYYPYAIYNPATGVADFLFSANSTTPNSLPSGFSKYKRVGSIYVNSSGNIEAFKCFALGNDRLQFSWILSNIVVETTSAALTTSNQTLTLRVPAITNCEPLLKWFWQSSSLSGTAFCQIIISSGLNTLSQGIIANGGGTSLSQYIDTRGLLTSNSQIFYKTDTTNVTGALMRVLNVGWIDNLI